MYMQLKYVHMHSIRTHNMGRSGDVQDSQIMKWSVRGRVVENVKVTAYIPEPTTSVEVGGINGRPAQSG